MITGSMRFADLAAHFPRPDTGATRIEPCHLRFPIKSMKYQGFISDPVIEKNQTT